MDNKEVIESFHKLFYNSGLWANGTDWMGIPIQKCPLDLWVYQNIMHELRPNLIIETGTYLGGSALFLAHLCDLLHNGKIVTVDITVYDPRPKHDRILYLKGRSVDQNVVADIRKMAEGRDPIIVILDSDHTKANVLAELNAYAPMVTIGSYLIVEDTNVNGHPIEWNLGPGPMEAIEEFLPKHPEFEVDRSREKFLMTQNSGGYLRRKG